MNNIYEMYKKSKDFVNEQVQELKIQQKELEKKYNETIKKDSLCMREIEDKYGDLAQDYAQSHKIGPVYRSGQPMYPSSWSIEEDGVELFWDADHPHDYQYETILWEDLFSYEKSSQEN